MEINLAEEEMDSKKNARTPAVNEVVFSTPAMPSVITSKAMLPH
jgi:hypothetical protein